MEDVKGIVREARATREDECCKDQQMNGMLRPDFVVHHEKNARFSDLLLWTCISLQME